MYKNATKCNKTQSKWCINKHGASKIIDTFETYQSPEGSFPHHRHLGKYWLDLCYHQSHHDHQSQSLNHHPLHCVYFNVSFSSSHCYLVQAMIVLDQVSCAAFGMGHGHVTNPLNSSE
jgi:hypothetical protein